MEKLSQTEQQYSLANKLVAFYYVAGAVVALLVCIANGEPGVALGVLAIFGLQALVINFGGQSADVSPAVLRMRELRFDGAAPQRTKRPANELAQQSKCWQFWPKNSADQSLATRSNCWKYWPDNGQMQALAR